MVTDEIRHINIYINAEKNQANQVDIVSPLIGNDTNEHIDLFCEDVYNTWMDDEHLPPSGRYTDTSAVQQLTRTLLENVEYFCRRDMWASIGGMDMYEFRLKFLKRLRYVNASHIHRDDLVLINEFMKRVE